MKPGRAIFLLTTNAAARHSLNAVFSRNDIGVHPFVDGHDLIEALPYLGPGCIIFDTRLPPPISMDLPLLVATRPDLPAVALVEAGDMRTAVRAIKDGAVDIIEVPLVERYLLDILDNLVPLDPILDQHAARRTCAKDVLTKLTPRERQVASGILAGMTNRSIAGVLGIGVRTVETHRARMLEKLAVKSVSEIVRMALEAGLEPLCLVGKAA